MHHGGYVIFEVEITDAGRYGEFLGQVTATVEGHGGKFIARGDAIDVVEGDWTPPRLALLKFDSVAQAKAWLNSPEYTALSELRTSSSNINMVIVEGL